MTNGWKLLARWDEMVIPSVGLVMQWKVLVGYWVTKGASGSRSSASERGRIVGGVIKITVNDDRGAERSRVKYAKGQSGASTKY